MAVKSENDSDGGQTNPFTTNNSMLVRNLDENATHAISEVNIDQKPHFHIIDSANSRHSASPMKLHKSMMDGDDTVETPKDNHI